MMPMAGQTTADILVPPVSDYMCRQQVWDGVTKILPQPQITESNKKMLMQLAFDHMEKSCKALEDHKLVPKVMPADALAKGSLQHYGRNQQPRAATQPRRARR